MAFFSGSKVGREFSYLNIDNRLEENACASLLESAKQKLREQKEEVQPSVSHSDDGFGISLGLLNGTRPTMPLPQKKQSSIA